MPKYRKRELKGKLAKRIEALLRECAEINGWEMHELNVRSDHIRMLIQINPDISIDKAIRLFKNGSNKVIREEFPELEEYVWGDSFWCDGYFVETIGQVNWDVIREYIKNQ